MKDVIITLLALSLLLQLIVLYNIAAKYELWKPRPKIISVKLFDSKVLEGLAVDGEKMYFSLKDGLYMVSINNIKKAIIGKEGVIPEDLRNQGYNHMGDIDIYEDKIYVPLENEFHKKPLIAIYLANTLEHVKNIGPLSQKDISWCTIDPVARTILTSESDEVNEIFVYDFEGKLIRKIKLSTNLYKIRGGKILGRHLYLTADDRRGIIYKVDVETGDVEAYFKIETPFRMKGIGYSKGRLYVLVISENSANSILFTIDLFSDSVNVATIAYMLILAILFTTAVIYFMIKPKS